MTKHLQSNHQWHWSFVQGLTWRKCTTIRSCKIPGVRKRFHTGSHYIAMRNLTSLSSQMTRALRYRVPSCEGTLWVQRCSRQGTQLWRYAVGTEVQRTTSHWKHQHFPINILWTRAKVKIFGNSPNKLKLHSWRTVEHTELMEYLLLFSPESFVIPFAVKIHKD